MRTCWTCALLLLVALVSFRNTLNSAPVGEEKKEKATASAVEKLRKELDKTITVEIDEQPLHLAIAQLKEQTKINFVLDKLTMAGMGLDPEQSAVKVKLKDVKVRTALRSLLTPYNLSFAILEGEVFISSEEMAIHRQMRQRVSIDLEKTEFSKALKQLARETGTNLVIDSRIVKDAQAPVTLQLDDVPLETAVRLMAETVSLKPVKVGNVLFVTSKANATEMRADPELNPQPMPMPGEKEPGFVPRPGVLVPALPAKPADAKVDPDKPESEVKPIKK